MKLSFDDYEGFVFIKIHVVFQESKNKQLEEEILLNKDKLYSELNSEYGVWIDRGAIYATEDELVEFDVYPSDYTNPLWTFYFEDLYDISKGTEDIDSTKQGESYHQYLKAKTRGETLVAFGYDDTSEYEYALLSVKIVHQEVKDFYLKNKP